MKNPRIVFKPSGRGKAQCPPNPQYPDGIAIDGAGAGPACKVSLPYPAPECGMWMVECDECPLTIGISAAGRADDPISVRIACRRKVDSN